MLYFSKACQFPFFHLFSPLQVGIRGQVIISAIEKGCKFKGVMKLSKSKNAQHVIFHWIGISFYSCIIMFFMLFSLIVFKSVCYVFRTVDKSSPFLILA